MSLSQFRPSDGRVLVESADGPRRVGHAHFWERAMSRGQFVKTAAGAAVLALGSGLLTPGRALAAGRGSRPRPIPGGIRIPGLGFFHVFPPAPGNEPSTITDFAGYVGVAEIDGKGTGISPNGKSRRLLFDVDMRFMKGLYLGFDGFLHQGTFAFV